MIFQDNCPGISDSCQEDTEITLVMMMMMMKNFRFQDNCPSISNSYQEDTDGDYLGDNFDDDDNLMMI